MGPLDASLWVGQFLLSTACAILVFRRFRSIKPLFWYLAFRSAADFVNFFLFAASDPSNLWSPYRWANYAQRTAQYVILAALVMRAIGESTNADNRTVRMYGGLAAAIGLLVLVAAHSGPWTAFSLLQIGARADFVLAVLLAGALLLREFDGIAAPLEKPWALISGGILVLLGSHAACSELLRHGIVGGLLASRLMAVGQLAGLGVWIAAVGWREHVVAAEQEEIEPPRFQPESVTMVEEVNQWVN